VNISDEAVDAARRAVHGAAAGWGAPLNDALAQYIAHRVIEAATPFIAAQAWDEGWNAFARYDSNQRQSYPDNPYRSGT